MSTTYRTYSDFMKDKFGCKIQKIVVNMGSGCPNRDGTVGYGGCIYCNNRSFSPSYTSVSHNLKQQIAAGKEFFAKKYSDMKFLVYFQSYTSTYGDADKLKHVYADALDDPDVVGVVIGTRPDCLADELLNMLKDLSDETGKEVIIELGAESSHDETLDLINRCHSWQCVVDATNRVSAKGFSVGLHFIMGLPGETTEMMMTTIDRINELPIDVVKFHHLQVIKNTLLERMIDCGEIEVNPFSLNEYLGLCVNIVKRLRKDIAIDRFTSQSPDNLVIMPRWGIKNHVFVDKLNKLLS